MIPPIATISTEAFPPLRHSTQHTKAVKSGSRVSPPVFPSLSFGQVLDKALNAA